MVIIMHLASLGLSHFRNFVAFKIKFSPRITLIVGDNSQGKTNLLEAIHFLGTTHSFRQGTEREMICFGQERAFIQGQVVMDQSHSVRLEIVLARGEEKEKSEPLKRLLVNGVSKKAANFVGNLKVVQFWPEDLELVVDSPSSRRRHLDLFLGQTDSEYHQGVVDYDKVLRRRNRLLMLMREGKTSGDQLDFWDQQLVILGGKLTDLRSKFFTFLNDWLSPFEQKFSWQYLPSELTLAKIQQTRPRDMAAAATLSGPHRDEFRFLLKGRDLAFFGSRGEQRLSVFALKLAEVDYVSYVTRVRPILLLDDIFSELDRTHRHQVVDIVDKQQTIITTTDADFFDGNMIGAAEIVKIASGQVVDH